MDSSKKIFKNYVYDERLISTSIPCNLSLRALLASYSFSSVSAFGMELLLSSPTNKYGTYVYDYAGYKISPNSEEASIMSGLIQKSNFYSYILEDNAII